MTALQAEINRASAVEWEPTQAHDYLDVYRATLEYLQGEADPVAEAKRIMTKRVGGATIMACWFVVLDK